MTTKKHAYFLFAFAVISAIGCGQSCDGTTMTTDPKSCTQNTGLCSVGNVCDAASDRCVPITSKCMTAKDCPQSANPNDMPNGCKGGSCLPVECIDNTKCSDPMKSICNTTNETYQCIGCVKDTDCATGSSCWTDKGVTASDLTIAMGQCVSTSDVAYVGATNCSDGNGAMGTSAAPFCTVDKAVASSVKVIRVKGKTTSYTVMQLIGKTVTIVGDGRDASMPTKFDSLDVMGGDVTVIGVVVQPSLTTAAVICRGGAKLSLYELSIDNNSNGRGVDADSTKGCAELNLERSKIVSSNYGLILAGNATQLKYHIVNNAWTFTSMSGTGGSGTEPNAVSIGFNATGEFGFNTITKYLKGVICSSNQPIYDSIISGVTTAGSEVVGCSMPIPQYVYTGTMVDFDIVAPEYEPKLKTSGTNNSSCCVNKDVNPPAVLNAKTDYFNNPRPLLGDGQKTSGGSYDIGFQELP